MTLSSRLFAPLVALAITPGACALAAGADTPSSHDFSVSLGASSWAGDFGAPTRSTISAILPTATYRNNGLRLTASIPWMRLDSRGAIFTGIDGAPIIVSPAAALSPKVRQGVGDLTLGASYLLPAATAIGVDIDLSVKAKLPTGSKRRVSTGKTDLALGTELSKQIGDFTPSLAVRYRAFGDAGRWRLKNGFATSVGGAYQAPADVVLVLSYDYAQAASALIGDAHELVGGVSAPLGSRGLRATGFVSKGLSRGAADVSGGLSLSKKF